MRNAHEVLIRARCRARLVALGLLATAVLGRLGAPAQAAASADGGAATVSGRVLHALSQEPVGGAFVSIEGASMTTRAA